MELLTCEDYGGSARARGDAATPIEDRDGLIEQLAARLWESRVDDGSRRQWDTCPAYWRALFIDHAGVAIDML